MPGPVTLMREPHRTGSCRKALVLSCPGRHPGRLQFREQRAPFLLHLSGRSLRCLGSWLLLLSHVNSRVRSTGFSPCRSRKIWMSCWQFWMRILLPRSRAIAPMLWSQSMVQCRAPNLGRLLHLIWLGASEVHGFRFGLSDQVRCAAFLYVRFVVPCESC